MMMWMHVAILLLMAYSLFQGRSRRLQVLVAQEARADILERMTRTIAEELEKKTATSAHAVSESLVSLSKKLDVNTEVSMKAAEASAEAAHVANSTNEKIKATNSQVEELHKQVLDKLSLLVNEKSK